MTRQRDGRETERVGRMFVRHSRSHRMESGLHSAPKAHWDVLASVDFTTIDVWTKSGLVTYYLLFFVELATRRAQFAGLTLNPDEA